MDNDAVPCPRCEEIELDGGLRFAQRQELYGAMSVEVQAAIKVCSHSRMIYFRFFQVVVSVVTLLYRK